MRGSFEDGPGDGQPLPFAAGQLDAALADHRVVAVRQPRDEIVDVGGAAGGLQLRRRRARPGVHQVGADGVVEQVRVLRHHADLRRH